ncbi:MAG: hypothetical protein ACR2NX_16725 [Chthoniobacterales bacterium]
MRWCPEWTWRLRLFLFPRSGDSWLALLRIGLGAQLIGYCWSLGGNWISYFGGDGDGFVTRRLSEAITESQSPLVPILSWFVAAADRLGVRDLDTLWFLWWLLLMAGVFLVVGLASRFAAITGWLLHLAASKSGVLLTYGVDELMTIGLFYLMLSPLPDRFTADARLFGRTSWGKARQLGFWRRVLQLHLCLIYFFGGLAKALGRGWWNGDNLWRALTRPPFNVAPPEWIARFGWALLPTGIAICVIEVGYPFLIWRGAWRKLWLALVCAMHLGIALLMGLRLFGLVMIVLNLAAFGTPLRSPRFRLDPSRDALR